MHKTNGEERPTGNHKTHHKGNLKAEISLMFGYEKYLFALKGKEIEELEYQCGKTGFGVIYQRVMLGQWAVSDLSYIIRLGLIGGGMNILKAQELTERHCVPPYAGESRAEDVARAILAATMVGFEDIKDKPPVGEKKRPVKAQKSA